jgi:hypothetical protein
MIGYQFASPCDTGFLWGVNVGLAFPSKTKAEADKVSEQERWQDPGTVDRGTKPQVEQPEETKPPEKSPGAPAKPSEPPQKRRFTN